VRLSTKWIKVFCFFFSKKKRFSSFHQPFGGSAWPREAEAWSIGPIVLSDVAREWSPPAW